MSYVPEFVALYEINPYIEYLPLDDETIRVAVKDYLEGGDLKDAIIKKYGKIEDWNTSKVTNMSGLFKGFFYDDNVGVCSLMIKQCYYYFNEDISKWDTSNVIYMEEMFSLTKNFNQPIGRWNTSNVTNMSHMFEFAINFNQPIEKWDTSNVTDMGYMFLRAESFNQPIEKWDTSNVTTMEDMFDYAESFNLENAPWYHE